MKHRTAIVAGLMALGLCGASAAQAQTYYGYGPRYYDQALPPYEIMRIVRSTGLVPLSRPMRRGPTYVVVATNRSGGQMRVVVDALRGDILNVNPMVAMRPYSAQSYYPGGPAPEEPPGAYGGDHRFDGGVPPVPPRDVPATRMMPPPAMAPPATGMGPPPPPRDSPNPRIANAPPLTSPAPPAPARTPLPRPRPNIAASEPATTDAVPAALPATSKVPAASLPTAIAPAIINPATAPTQIVPVAPLE